MMALTSVAVSFWGKVDSVCQHTEAVGNEELWDSTRKRKRGTNSTDSASTPLFWRVGRFSRPRFCNNYARDFGYRQSKANRFYLKRQNT
jgi:hypothetical protein